MAFSKALGYLMALIVIICAAMSEKAAETTDLTSSNGPLVPAVFDEGLVGALALGTDLLATAANGTHEPAKRWFGVPESDENTDKEEDDTWWAWPVKCPGSENSPVVQPVRYCWKDKRSADNLEDIMNRAIAKWGPAMVEEVSALSIDLDEGTGDDHHVYCDDPRISDDALVISDKTKDGDDDDTKEWNWEMCETQSTTGYDYSSKERGRHTLEFCFLKPDEPEKSKPWAIRAMMHELGHVMGLSHEHQRPDRDDFLTFKCKNLIGYEEAWKKADIDEDALFDDDAEDDKPFKMDSACNDATYAKAYMPQALSFIKCHPDYNDDPKCQHFDLSSEFDKYSIMNYDSDENSVEKGKKKVIYLKNNTPIWMGGHNDPEKASISAGDIARIAQLYPSGTEAGEAAKKGDVWGAKQVVRVRVRDVLETTVLVAPTPTEVLWRY